MNKLRILITIFVLFLLLCSTVSVIHASQSQRYTSQAEKDYRLGKKHLAKNKTSAAIKYLKRAGHKGHESAQYHLGILYYQQKQYKKARFWLRKRANAGEADAQYHYANTFRFGLGTKQQTTIARRLYQKAAKQGHIHAQFELAKMFQNGIGAKQSTQRAKQWYKKAAKAGHSNAKKALAILESKKSKKIAKSSKKAHSTQKTPKKAQKAPPPPIPNKSEELLADAFKGDPETQYQLAMRYLLAYEIDNDVSQAIYWLTQAAEKKHAMAEYQLANQYFKGIHIEQNMARAIHYFLRAHNQGIKAADTALRTISTYGFETVVRAEMGDREAQYEMALQYLQGKTNLNKNIALEWLEASANRAYAPALLQLGNMHEVGNLYKQSYAKAFTFYQKAAELENPEAQYRLSQMYQTGKGTKTNAKLANTWLNRAANQGFPAAQKAQQLSEL